MITNLFPENTYHAELTRLNSTLNSLKHTKNRIAWGRLAAILLLIASAFYLWPVSQLLAILASSIFLGIFIRLLVLAANNSTAIENCNRLISINQQEISIAAGAYTQLPNGSKFLQPTHYYANDLDIFGRASVYQYINRTLSEQGNGFLANWLSSPSALPQIMARQEASKELAPAFQWRQQLQAHGMAATITNSTETNIRDWLQQPNKFSHNGGWNMLRILYPVFTIGLLACYLFSVIPGSWFLGAYAVFFIVSSQIKKIIFPEYIELNSIVPEMNALYQSVASIETQSFTSGYLQALQQKFKDGQSSSADSIKKLKNLLDKFDDSLNMFMAFILGPLLLWELQLVFELEKWRTANAARAGEWFKALGEMEAVSSIANLHFNHADWVYPAFDAAMHGSLIAKDLGHPLIPAAQRVCNDFNTAGLAQVALITGSNMAGKSTFLRSIGVNMVLAMMGAPVCASYMKTSVMQIVSSMRVADNLEENTSTFYAELKKLKAIIECVNRHDKVFVLLDEILRGTNSLDRHTGSKALVKQLIGKDAVAMLATHDVELAQMVNDYPANIHNYHFDAQIDKEELYFDYKLKTGICKSINASLLMKKIGIEL
jgi:hypothetical protein